MKRGAAPLDARSRIGSDEMVFDDEEEGAPVGGEVERSWQFKSVEEYDGDVEFIYERIKSKADGSVRVRKYQKLEFLGKGGFAHCYRVYDEELRRYLAAKIVSKASLLREKTRQKLMSEIRIHKSLRHDNVVRFEHFFEDSNNVYLLLELCSNKTLLDLVVRRKQLHELECQCLIRQICRGLEHIHDNRIVHRDLKLGNLFLNDRMEVKIGDFGLAAKIEFYGQQRDTMCGTPNFLAPEILDMEGEGHSYEVDIWALGVILYAMLVGTPPFEGKDVQSTYGRIKGVRYDFPDSSRLSLQSKDLVGQMLKPDPLDRPTIPEILSHPWMKSKCGIPEVLPTKFLY